MCQVYNPASTPLFRSLTKNRGEGELPAGTHRSRKPGAAGRQTGCSHRILQAAEMQENFRLPVVLEIILKSRIDTIGHGGTSPVIQASGLAESEYRVRRVRFFERCNLFGCKPQRQCGYRIGKMVRLGGAHNRRSDEWFAEHPGERKLSAGNAALFGEFTEPVDDFMVRFFRLRIQRLAELIRLEAFCALGLPRARQAPTRPRASGLHGSTPMPSAWQSGIISRSSSRYSRL